MLSTPFYDPNKSYEENFEAGPFGAFADGKIFEDIGEPQYEFLGHKVYSPFGIPAGPLINGNFVQAALDKGFDVVTYKTVRTKSYPCHPFPNVLSVDVDGDLTLEKASHKLVAHQKYTEPLSITNSFGVPSQGPEFWQDDLRRVVQSAKKGQVVIGAFQGTKTVGGDVAAYIDDYRQCAKLLMETGVSVVEVNLSCPNEGTANLLCFDTERSVQVAKAIKEVIGNIPLIIKIAYFEDEDAFSHFVKEIGCVVDGISAINTIAAEVVDEHGVQALPGEGRLRSGVCGHSIKWAGLAMIKKLKMLRETFEYTYTIIGVGGVTTKEDYKEYRDAGADAVMSATGAMWNPYLAQEIKKE